MSDAPASRAACAWSRLAMECPMDATTLLWTNPRMALMEPGSSGARVTIDVEDRSPYLCHHSLA